MIPVAILFMLVALTSIAYGIVLIETNWQNRDITGIISDVVMIIGACAVILICALGIREEIINHEDRYSASKYRIETEITTRGDVSDTTYVIIKK